MYYKIKNMFVSIALIVILVGCGATSSDTGDMNTNTITATSGDIIISQLNPYKSGYFTNFVTQNGNNFFEHTDNSLHIAFVDDYELYYAKSTDSGKSWKKEKVNTGYDGDIRRASLVVDNNGKVFIGFNVHTKYNYANPTAVSYGYEFNYELYCANNINTIWNIEKIDTFNKSTNSHPNDGAEVADMIIDSNNNLHLFTNYAGWWNYGGVAHEYTRTASLGSWSSSNIIAKYDDTIVDKAFYSYFKAHIKANGDTIVLMQRYKSDGGVNDKLLYAYKISGIWQEPIEINSPNRANARNAHFDMTIDGDEKIQMVYLQDNSNGVPEVLLYSSITSSIIYTGVVGEIINDIKLVSNSIGNLTLLITRKDKSAIVFTKTDTGNWSQQISLNTKDTNGVMYNAVVARTNHLQNHFASLKIAYKKYVEGVTIGSEVNYDSSTLYFYDYEVTPISTPTPTTSTTCSMSGTWNVDGGTQVTTYPINGAEISIPVPDNTLILTDNSSTVSANQHIVTFDPNKAPYIYTLTDDSMERSETNTQTGCNQEIKEVWTITNCTTATISIDILNRCTDSQGDSNGVFNTTAVKQ